MKLNEMQELNTRWREAYVKADNATMWGNTKEQRAAWLYVEQVTQEIGSKLGISPDELQRQVNVWEGI